MIPQEQKDISRNIHLIKIRKERLELDLKKKSLDKPEELKVEARVRSLDRTA